MPDDLTLTVAYARCFEGEAGRLVLEDLARRGLLRESTFHPDPHRAAFNEGRRSLALHVLRMLERPGAARQAPAPAHHP